MFIACVHSHDLQCISFELLNEGSHMLSLVGKKERERGREEREEGRKEGNKGERKEGKERK